MSITFNSRYYVYGCNDGGCHEFLTTFLTEEQGIKYCKDHSKTFKERFTHYLVKTLSTDGVIFNPNRE